MIFDAQSSDSNPDTSPEIEPNAENDGPPSASSDSGAADAPAGTGDAAVKKKRRRRGGKNRKKKTGAGAAEGAAPAEGEVGEAGEEAGDEAGDESAEPMPAKEPPQKAPQPARPQNQPGERRGDREQRGAGGSGGGRRDDRHRAGGGRDRRSGGGAGGGGGGAGGSGGGRDRSAHYNEHTEDSSEAPVTPRVPRERREPQIPTKEWEEIFEGKTFESLGLRNSVLKGVEAAGFKSPTKIQAELIPLVIAGKDVIGQSRTGTGKTAAFGLPLFNNAIRELPFQSLILAPTRELAIQIAAELTELGKFTPIRVSAVYGGQAVHSQARKLEKGPEIIVATPGRLMDMVERGHIHLHNVKFAILDEVDRMLDIGFRDDIKKILGGIKGEHQTVFVSATISEEIERLARTYMKTPEKLVTTGGSLTVSLVQQHYISVQPWDKRKMLLHCLTHEDPDLTLVFCRMKRTVDDVVKFLCNHGIDAHGMHGDLQQGRRNTVMARLREGTLGVLVASDLAARGLDVDGISHVINYDLPEDPEVYIHRIGRTARAGRGGVAWSLVTPEQGPLLTAIEKLANTHVPEKSYPDFKLGAPPAEVQARRQAEDMRRQSMQGNSRFNAPTLPAAAAPAPAPAASGVGTAAKAAPVAVSVQADASRFPGGIVPAMLPPKRLMGRVRTSRSGPPKPAPSLLPGSASAPAPTPTPTDSTNHAPSADGSDANNG
ncbi:MAG: DEAD/DEAH box helicase [Phycisphaerales bacterium]